MVFRVSLGVFRLERKNFLTFVRSESRNQIVVLPSIVKVPGSLKRPFEDFERLPSDVYARHLDEGEPFLSRVKVYLSFVSTLPQQNSGE